MKYFYVIVLIFCLLFFMPLSVLGEGFDPSDPRNEIEHSDPLKDLFVEIVKAIINGFLSQTDEAVGTFGPASIQFIDQSNNICDVEFGRRLFFSIGTNDVGWEKLPLNFKFNAGYQGFFGQDLQLHQGVFTVKYLFTPKNDKIYLLSQFGGPLFVSAKYNEHDVFNNNLNMYSVGAGIHLYKNSSFKISLDMMYMNFNGTAKFMNNNTKESFLAEAVETILFLFSIKPVDVQVDTNK